MQKTGKIVMLLVLVSLVLVAFTGCDLGDDKVTGSVEILPDLTEVNIDSFGLLTSDVGTLSTVEQRFDNYRLEFKLISNGNVIDTEKVLVGELGEDISIIFDGLYEGDYTVEVSLIADHNEKSDVKLAYGIKDIEVVADTVERYDILLELRNGGLDVIINRFPGDYDVEIEIAGVKRSFTETNNNRIWTGLNPKQHSMEISWGNNVKFEQEIMVFPGMTKNVMINLYDGQAEIGIIWELPPDAPDDVEAELIENGIEISWGSVDDADSYNILRYRKPYHTDGYVQVGNTENTNFIYNNPKKGYSYRFKVVAVNEREDGFNLTSDYSQPTETILYHPDNPLSVREYEADTCEEQYNQLESINLSDPFTLTVYNPSMAGQDSYNYAVTTYFEDVGSSPSNRASQPSVPLSFNEDGFASVTIGSPGVDADVNAWWDATTINNIEVPEGSEKMWVESD